MSNQNLGIKIYGNQKYVPGDRVRIIYSHRSFSEVFIIRSVVYDVEVQTKDPDVCIKYKLFRIADGHEYKTNEVYEHNSLIEQGDLVLFERYEDILQKRTYTYRDLLIAEYEPEKRKFNFLKEVVDCKMIPQDMLLLSQFLQTCYLHSQGLIDIQYLQSINVA